MNSRRSMIRNVNVAVIQTDVKWIREKLVDIEKKVDNVQMCTQGHDNRIQKLEDENKIKKEAQQISTGKLALMITGITAVVNFFLWIIEHLVLG